METSAACQMEYPQDRLPDRSTWFVKLLLLFLVAGASALALRLPQLDRRPMHTDESVQALKFKELWEKGEYRYDPNEFHGPSLNYATLPFVWLGPARNFAELSESNLRLVPVVFGLGLILLLPLLFDGLGFRPALFAGVLTAISPAMVFYSRYYIHEMLFVFVTMLAIAAAWRYARSRHWMWAAIAGLGLGLMHATKETCVFNFAAMAAAMGLVFAWNRRRQPSLVTGKALPPIRHIVLGAAVALVISLLFFSSFFANPAGPLDSIRTYLPWLNRAGGQTTHLHPWHYYLGLLAFSHHPKGPIWTEGLILVLALIGTWASLTGKRLRETNVSLARFLVFYTLMLTGIYSLIPYKTPWCLLGFLHGMILLAGIGVAALWNLCCCRISRGVLSVVLVVAAGHLAWQAWRASYPLCADRQNPYVYAQTRPDLLGLVRQLDKLAQTHPQGYQMPVQVITPGADYWPLPWYLRAFSQVAFWDKLPDNLDAPVVIGSSKLNRTLVAKLDPTHMDIGYYELRPSVFLAAHVRMNLWEAYLKKFPPARDDGE